MRLSVLIPTYKRPAALKRNLESLIGCHVNYSEVVIGDDGGDEETLNIIERYSEKLPVKYLPPIGRGSLATNITRILKAASQEWVLLIHDDDFIVGDHSSYPYSFENTCDFFFTNHFIAEESGKINQEESIANSDRFGRSSLVEGLQKDVFDIIFNQRICLDGFYARRTLLSTHFPNPEIGSVADYFWLFNVLQTPGVRVCYSPQYTFAYTLSTVGLTAGGLNRDLVKGFKMLKASSKSNIEKSMFERQISLNTWFAINGLIRKGEKKEAFNLLKAIRFRYRHSFKHQFLMPLQILWILIGIKSRN